MSLIPGPCCLNCEKQKKVQQPITLGSSSGYICDECYNSNIWANTLRKKYVVSVEKLLQLLEREV